MKLSISPAVATYVRPGTPTEVKLAGCSAAEQMSTHDCVALLFCLSKDADQHVRTTAISVIEHLSAEIIQEYCTSETSNPFIMTALSALCRNYGATEPEAETADVLVDEELAEATAEDEEDDEPVNEEEPEFLSKYKTAQLMGIAEKIKMALSGDKEWRAILVKDSNKLVSGSVIKNPRITEAEILTLVKSGIQNDEIMRLICANKEWIKSYKIRKALVENNRTPVQNAMRYLGTMGEKDLAAFAKSKNISSVISTLAKRLLLNKKK